MAPGLSAIGGHWSFTPALAAGEIRSAAAAATPRAASQIEPLDRITACMLVSPPVNLALGQSRWIGIRSARSTRPAEPLANSRLRVRARAVHRLLRTQRRTAL